MGEIGEEIVFEDVVVSNFQVKEPFHLFRGLHGDGLDRVGGESFVGARVEP